MSHLLEGTDVGTVFLDQELRIRRFTSRIASVFRFQATDIGRQLGDFSHNIARPQLMEEIEAAMRHGQVMEDEVRDRGGTPFFLRILPYRVNKNGNGNGNGSAADSPIEGVVLTLTDMTAVDRARVKVDQLSAIVEASDDAIFALAPDGTIAQWNRGAELMFAHAADDAIGRDVAMLVQPGSDHQLAFYLRKLEQGQKVEHVSALCMRADGTRVDVLTTLSPIYTKGMFSGVAAIGRDVSRILQTQRALEGEQQKVRQLLDQANESSRMRERFLAMLSHELRNPLAAVMTASSALSENPPPKLAEKAHAVIERQARQMKRLLDDILDVSRITSEKLVIDRTDVDLRESIDTAIESTAPVFEERRVHLEHEGPMFAIPVSGDGKRLAQVFANLLANAATHSPAGATVRMAALVRRNVVEVVVSDSGSGIEPALQARIFDLFVQGEQQLDRSRGGLGVGLSLAKTIVELHGGTIAVRSEGLGKGSAFTVTLPIGTVVRQPAINQGIPGGSCRIVLVDDQDDSRSMLRALFEAHEHVVFDAADGPEAVALIEAHRPDVAFIDIGLPLMNGFEVAQQIRRRRDLDEVMLVALTGYGGDADVEAARAAGFDEHITKPAELAQLQRILERKKPMTDA
jgi:two-component system CheB/CheR fusion protein